MMEWRLQTLKKAIAKGKGDDFIDRYLSMLHHTFTIFKTKPRLFETFARMQLEGEPLEQGMEIDGALLHEEFADVDQDFVREFGQLTGSLIYTSLMFCVFGKQPFDEAWSRIERMARRFARSYSR